MRVVKVLDAGALFSQRQADIVEFVLESQRRQTEQAVLISNRWKYHCTHKDIL